jgi:hypothetical protein
MMSLVEAGSGREQALVSGVREVRSSPVRIYEEFVNFASRSTDLGGIWEICHVFARIVKYGIWQNLAQSNSVGKSRRKPLWYLFLDNPPKTPIYVDPLYLDTCMLCSSFDGEARQT